MDESVDRVREHMLDGNAAAGILQEIFGEEMTASPTECDHCGQVGQLGTLLAFAPGTGLVLRCSACEGVVLRVVQTADYVYLDARGAVFLRVARRTA